MTRTPAALLTAVVLCLGMPPGAAHAGPASTEGMRVPAAPPIGLATSGAQGGSATATVRWGTPSSNGGAEVVFWQIRAYRLDASNRVVKVHHASSQVPISRLLSVALPRGRYKFRVQAWNRVGGSAWSQASRIVTSR